MDRVPSTAPATAPKLETGGMMSEQTSVDPPQPRRDDDVDDANTERYERDARARIVELERERKALADRVHALEEMCRDNVRATTELKSYQAELEAQNGALREAQGSLEESRSRYADLYDFAPIPYFTFDKNGVVIEVNLTGAMLLGRNRSRLLGKPFLSLAQFANADEFNRHLLRVLEATGPVTGEVSLTMGRRHVDGQLVSACVRSPRGEPVACRTAIIDVTQQRIAEREARAAHTSELSMRRKLELIDRASAHITAAIADVGGDLEPFLRLVVEQARLVVDAEFAALGIGGDDGKRFDPWVFSGMPSTVAESLGSRSPRPGGLLGAVMLSGRALRLRDVREHPAFVPMPGQHPVMTSFLGVPIHFHGRSRGNIYFTNKHGSHEFTAEDQQIAEMLADRVGVALEIARLRQIERRERRRLELVARAGLAFAESIDFDETVNAILQLIVPATADACALDLADHHGKLQCVAVHHRDPANLDRVARERFASADEIAAAVAGTAWSTQSGSGVRRLAADHALLRGFAGGNGAPEGWAVAAPLFVRGRMTGVLTLAWTETARRYSDDDCVIITEIAQQAAFALEAADLYRTAQSAVRSRDSLLAIVSHDLRNYLTSIRLAGKFLLRDDVRHEARTTQRHVDSIIRSATMMDQLIGTLHDATMIESGHFTVSLKPVEICSVMEEARQMLEPQTEARSLRLRIERPDGGAVVRADRARLLQVIANLVGNAAKFTGAGGDVTIIVEKVDGAVRISVRDTGCGMDQEVLTHIFERHWKSSGVVENAESGSGLGLFIVKGIVEAHGGEVSVKSGRGVGTELSFTIPTVPNANDGK